jgi:hypothetical protein
MDSARKKALLPTFQYFSWLIQLSPERTAVLPYIITGLRAYNDHISDLYRCFHIWTFFFILSGVRLSLLVLRTLLAYCTSPRWSVIATVEKLVEWRLAGETELLWENLPQLHFVHYKSHMTRPGFEPIWSLSTNATASQLPLRSWFLYGTLHRAEW